MEIGTVFRMGFNSYEMLEIISKGKPEKDLLICRKLNVKNSVVKECFQRFDVYNPTNYTEFGSGYKAYTPKDPVNTIIRNAIKQGKSEQEIIDLVHKDYEFFNEKLLKDKIHKYQVKYRSQRPVEKLDEQGNVIARYSNLTEASIEENQARSFIAYHLNEIKTKKSQWRYADDN